MAASSRPADALLTEHFRYTPLSLIDDIINAVNTIIYRAIDAIESGLLSTPPAALGFAAAAASDSTIRDTDGDGNIEYPEARQEIEEGVHQLETLLEATVDKTFDRFEIYTLRNILTVPEDLEPWIRLSHYENVTIPPPPTAPTPESILQLRHSLREITTLNLALHHEHARNAALLANLQSLVSRSPPTKSKNADTTTPPPPAPFAFLTQPPNSTQALTQKTQLALTQKTQFALSQLPALRALLANLRPRLQTLPTKLENVDWESGREERRRYIEGRTRRFLEKRRGELGEEVGGMAG
ncbi:MAG: Mis12 domain [Lasallia pustulata]|uniref:Mis12 domain n=1 Tax=Lasallia pustulata TaxID=136370 RepID=A0A5M8PJ10_9LECA|nr:MAG: Mis12 domain [Lasallia pustulata]